MTLVAALLLVFSVVAAGAMAQQSAGGDLSGADKRLFESVFNNKLAAVKASIAMGADVGARNEWDMTAIDLAVDRGYFDIAHYLLSVRNRRHEEARAQAQSQAPAQAPAAEGVPLPAPVEAVAAVPLEQGVTAEPPAEAEVAVVDLAPPAEPPSEAEVVVVDLAPPAEPPSEQPSPFDPDGESPGEPLPIIGEVRGPEPAAEPPRTAALTEQPRPSETAPPEPPPLTTVAPSQPAAPETVDEAAEPSAVDRLFNRLGEIFGPDSETPGEAEPPPPPPQIGKPADAGPPASDAAEAVDNATGEAGEETGTTQQFLDRLGNLFATDSPEPPADPAVAPAPPTSAPPAAEEAATEPGTAARLIERLSNFFGSQESEPPAPQSPVEPNPETPLQEPGKLIDETTPEALASIAGEATGAGQTAESVLAEVPSGEPAEPATPPSAALETTEPGTEEAFTYEAVEAAPREVAAESSIGTEMPEITADPQAEPAAEPDPFATPPEETTAADPYANVPLDAETPDPFASLEAEAEQPAAEETPSEEPTELEELAPSEAEEPSEPSELDALAEQVEGSEAGETNGPSELDALAEGVGEGGTNDGENSDWTVKDLQTAQVPRPLPAKPAITKPSGVPLQGHQLTLGTRLRLGRDLRPENLEPGSGTPCIQKKKGTVVFCVEDVTWPPEMTPYFLVSSIMYQGAKAIVRYDEGNATYYHALFVTDSFNAIINFYVQRYGQPTETWTRRIAPLAAPRQPNPTVVWRSVEPVTKLTTHLEIRKFDDTRGGFPDTRRGAILLYHTWSTPIFPQLSTLELMLAK